MTEPVPGELLSYAEPGDPLLRRIAIRGIERLSGQPALARHYQTVRSRTVLTEGGASRFFAEALRELRIDVQFPSEGTSFIPRDGPLVFVANHPFGVVDGLALCRLAIETRGDVKVLIHRALFRDPELRRFMLPVDFGATRDAAKRNIAARDEGLAYLASGGTLAVFPGGGISTARGAFGPVTDLEWKLLPAKLIRAARATVVPVYFPGQNSWLFQAVSQFSLTLRLSLVIREIANKQGTTLHVRVGKPIPFDQLAPIRDRRALMDHLRAEVYRLAGGRPGGASEEPLARAS